EEAVTTGSPMHESPGLLGWWQRYQSYQQAWRRRPHTPGIWVVYFSLAALPLFGLGQSLIPVTDVDRRQRVFWLMVFYVGSGLGLRLTPSLLGLRVVLRQRKLVMPRTVAGVWLVTGGGLIVLLLAVGALLPRPQAEYPLVDLNLFRSREREEANSQEASQYAI